MQKTALSIFACLFSLISLGQDLDYAKAVVRKLASPDFKGRGYVGNGDLLAAQYIADEFKKLGLKSYKKSYFQKFTTPVNTFPGAVQLETDSSVLRPGVDFLVDPGSPAIFGRYPTLEVKIPYVLNLPVLRGLFRSAQEKFIVVEAFDRADYSKYDLTKIDEFIDFLRFHPNNNAAGSIILTDDKLTWSGSTRQYLRPTFTVKNDTTKGPIKYVTVNLQNEFIDRYKSQNVVGYVEGENTDSLVVFTAHYDHLGMMGSNTVFPGANDNASGIAMLLNLAKHYASNRPKYNTAFIAFGGEELGLLGSQHFVEKPLFDLEKVKFLINFDISGTGDEGIQVVNGSVYQDQFDRLKKINDDQNLLPEVKIRGAACNSDHCMFDAKNVPSFFIYTLGGIQAYHDIYDKAQTLPLTEFEDYFRLMVRFVDGI